MGGSTSLVTHHVRDRREPTKPAPEDLAVVHYRTAERSSGRDRTSSSTST